MSKAREYADEQLAKQTAPFYSALAATGKQQVGEVQRDGRSASEMADALERIAGSALSEYEGVETDELHILRCAKLIRDLASRHPVSE